MTWVKKGLLYAGHRSHAQCPTVLVLEDRLRIFYADRDERSRSYTAYFEVGRDNPRNLIWVHRDEIMERGKPGMFDSDGMMPSCAFKDGDGYALYYSGWNQGGTVPYRNAIGMLTSDDGEHWERVSDGPTMDRTQQDPIMCVTPWVMKDGGTWSMWYVSGTRWENVDGHLEPVYVIKYARWYPSSGWTPITGPCVEPKNEYEAFSNPTVLKNETGYTMWYCARDSRDYRGGAGSYRIEGAYSADGYSWRRAKGIGLDVSPDGWDSEMVAYPYYVEVDGRRLLFYNGNGFGRTGIGYAEWEGP